MKGTLREFSERRMPDGFLLDILRGVTGGTRFPAQSPRALTRFLPLVYSRASRSGSLVYEIPAAEGTGFSQLGIAEAIILMMLMVDD